MPITIQCEDEEFPLTDTQVGALWDAVCRERNFPDDTVTVRCVDAQEIRRLKREYLQEDAATNVLTFSYGEGEHDIALCLSVAEEEAADRKAVFNDYVALLLTHAFLHVTGMDHATVVDEQTMQAAEGRVLAAAGFPVHSLFTKEN